MTDILERVLGGGGGAVGGIFGEAREALVGGCWGLFMSAGFFFFFFAAGLAMLFNLEAPYTIANRPIMFPFVCVLGIAAMLSPVLGALFGAQSGMYSVVRHIGCFILFIGAVLGAMLAATLYL